MNFREINNKYSTDNIRKGIIRTKCLGDELDSATIVLTHIERINIEPYDLVELLNEFNDYEYYLVASFERNIVTRESRPLNDYTINLMSITKLLECIMLPNMTITNIGQNRKITEYLGYALKYFKNNYGNNVSLSSNLTSIFNSVVAPETTFNQPTLREYCDFLLQTKGYIAKLTYNNGFVLGCLNLNYRGGTFPIDKCDNIVESQSAEDYVTCLSSEFNEVVADDYITEYQKLKSSSYSFTSDTAKIETNYKIYDLRSLDVVSMGGSADECFSLFTQTNQNYGVMVFYYDSGNWVYKGEATLNIYPNDNISFSHTESLGKTTINVSGGNVSIVNNVLLESIYKAKDTLKVGEMAEKICYDTLYKNNTIYWNRSSNVIDGFNTFEDKKGIVTINDRTAIEYAYINRWILNHKSTINGSTFKRNDTTINFDPDWVQVLTYFDNNKQHIVVINQNKLYIGNVDQPYNWKNAKFKIVYKPYMSMMVKQKQPNKRHYIEQSNNSTNALTDLKSFYAQEVEKNNQLGNPTISFYGHSTADSVPFALGQTYVELVSTSTTTFDICTYILNKIEYETSSNIIQYKGTLTKDYSNRNIYTLLNREKRYYALPSVDESVIRQETIYADGNQWEDAFFTGVVFANVYNKKNGSLSFVGSIPCIRTKLDNNNYSFTINMYDNVSIGYITSDDTIDDSNVHVSEYIYYTDSWGECSYLRFVLSVGDVPNYNYINNESTSTKTFELGVGWSYLKDSREKLSMTILVNKK